MKSTVFWNRLQLAIVPSILEGLIISKMPLQASVALLDHFLATPDYVSTSHFVKFASYADKYLRLYFHELTSIPRNLCLEY